METETVTPYARMVKMIKQDPNAWSWVELVEVGFLAVLMGLADKPNIMELEISSLDGTGIAIFGKTPIPTKIYDILLKLVTNERSR